MKVYLFGFVCLLIFAAPDRLQSQANSGKPAPSEAGTSPPSATDYLIGPQDVLKIDVWKEPEISGSVPVRPDGKISLPLINDIQAAGLTALELSSQVTEKLKKYVSEPRVTVVVTAVNSRRVHVLGEVNHPGSFSLVPNMTVLQAISDAGGLTEFASGKKVYVLRNESGKQTKYPFNYRKVLKGENAEQNIELKPGDTIVVP